MTTVDDTPYVRSRLPYIEAGWSPIPIHGRLGTPAPGFTGREGAWVGAETSFVGLNSVDYGNVALRLPENVVGIDVDAYERGDVVKSGDLTLAILEGLLGPLPPTFISTARELPSGIRLFRLPEGIILGSTAEAAVRAKAGDHLDIIRSDHRFARCWPTPKPEIDGEYHWVGPSGNVMPDGFVPDVDMLPMLPGNWVDFLVTPPVGRTERPFTRSLEGRREAVEGDKVFRDVGEAVHFLDKHRTAALETPEGSGFNDALNGYSHALSSFVPEFFSLDEAWEMAESVCTAVFGSPNYQDRATITSGLERSQPPFLARRPTEDELADPFSDYCDTTALWEKQGRLGEADRRGQNRTETGMVLPDHEDSGAFLPEAFWAARPVFAHIRRAAWSALASPDGVLAAALGLVLAQAMPNLVLPAAVGTEASLNLMVVLCGTSSDGKSTCRKVAQAALGFEGEEVHRFSPSSGQGLSAQYQKFVKATKTEPEYMKRIRWSALAMVEESDTIRSLANNPTSTLSSELRKAAMGEDLGFGNMGETKTNLAEHSYRFVMLMCMQPELSGWLLDDSAGGLPQRFLWVSVQNGLVEDDIEMPGVWPVKLPIEAMGDPISGAPRSRAVMGYTEAIRAEIRATRRERLRARGGAEKLDGHQMLTRLKIAGALALLDGRKDISDEDWSLAEMITDTSIAARHWIQGEVAGAAARTNESIAKARGRGRVIEESIVADTVKVRCRERVLEILAESPGILRRTLRDRLSTAQKEFFSEVLDELLAEHLIRFEERSPGSAWYLQ